MTALSPDLVANLRQTLVKCGPFDDERALRALFVDQRIAPWRTDVPEANTPKERVDLLIDFLHDKYNAAEGKNALYLFLEVLRENVSPDDACRQELGEVARTLEMRPNLMRLVEAASQNVVLYEEPPIVARPGELFGREALLEKLDGLLAQARHVLLFGLPGSGKTALAAAAAEQYMEQRQKCVIWLECGHMEAGTAFDELADRLGTQGEKQAIYLATGDGDLKAVHDMLSHYPGYLLVLDNVWNGQALYEVLRAIPEEMPVLVTSRTAFAFGFDAVIAVDELKQQAALALLRAHASRELEDREAALALCEKLGHHAYALEIAGTLLKGGRRSVRQLLRRAGKTPHALGLPGKKSVQALLDESLATLDEAARGLFVAVGGLTVPATTPELLAAYGETDVEGAWAALDALDQHSLARYVPAGGPGASEDVAVDFYRFHDITFSYARALHKENGQDRQRLVAAVREYLAEHAADFEMVHRDLPNILAAARMAQEEDGDKLVEIVSRLTLEGYADNRGYGREILKRLEAAVRVVRERPEEKERQHYLLGKLGNAYFGRGEVEKALAAYREALALAPDARRAVLLQAIVGRVYARLGQADEADNHFDQAYERAEATGDDRVLLSVLEQESLAASYEEDYERVRALAERELAISMRLGDRVREAFARINLGSAELLGGAGAQAALAHHKEVYGIGKEEDNYILQAYALFAQAKDYDALDERERAAAYLDRAEALFHSMGNVQDAVDVRRFREASGYSQG